MSGLPVFFFDDRPKRLSDLGDQLEAFSRAVDFEIFRDDLLAALGYTNGPHGGRPPFDPVMMFKVLVIQAANNLSDERAELLINDRLSRRGLVGGNPLATSETQCGRVNTCCNMSADAEPTEANVVAESVRAIRRQRSLAVKMYNISQLGCPKMNWRSLFYVVVECIFSGMRPFVHLIFYLQRGVTLGVRAACFDDQGRIFLVRHSYISGWHMPGGGVERRETVWQALVKEIHEEGNLVIVGDPVIINIFQNRQLIALDHIVLFQCKVEQMKPMTPNLEIIDSGFFDPRELPTGTTMATRRRIDEIMLKQKSESVW